MLLLALGIGIYIWYKLQVLQSGAVETNVVPEEGIEEEISTSTHVESQSATKAVTDPIVVSGDRLTNSQKEALEALGFESDSITITPEMIMCAEEKLGRERLDEIVGGSAPGPLESLTLLPCIK